MIRSVASLGSVAIYYGTQEKNLLRLRILFKNLKGDGAGYRGAGGIPGIGGVKIAVSGGCSLTENLLKYGTPSKGSRNGGNYPPYGRRLPIQSQRGRDRDGDGFKLHRIPLHFFII